MWDLLGLDDTDEAVYRYDLRCPGAMEADVAARTGLTEAAVVASRERLIACGLLRREVHGEVRISPTGPATVAARLREDLDAEHHRRRRQVSLFQADMTRWLNEQILTSPTPRPQVDRLPSLEAARIRTEELLVNARTEVIRVDPRPSLDARTTDGETIPAEVRATRRGIAVRVIYPATQLTSPRMRRTVDRELQAGLSVRVAATPDTHLTVVDRTAAVVVDCREGEEPQILLIREALLVQTLQNLFEIGWMHAADAASYLGSAPAGAEVDISAEERLLLHMLGEGLKDEAVAKRLGVSVRTVRRKIYEVQQRLRADSRFQVGMLAARREWV